MSTLDNPQVFASFLDEDVATSSTTPQVTGLASPTPPALTIASATGLSEVTVKARSWLTVGTLG